MTTFDDFHKQFGKKDPLTLAKKVVKDRSDEETAGACRLFIYNMVEEIIKRPLTGEEHKKLSTIIKRAVYFENARLMVEKVDAQNKLSNLKLSLSPSTPNR